MTAKIGTTTFTERVKIALALSGKKKGEVAAEAGIGSPALSQWINGNSSSPSLDLVNAVAKACGVSAGWLASGEGAVRK